MKFSSVLYRSNPFEDIGFRLRAVASEEIKKGQLLLDGEVPLLSTHVISNCADATGAADAAADGAATHSNGTDRRLIAIERFDYFWLPDWTQFVDP